MKPIILFLIAALFSIHVFCQKQGQALTDSLLAEIPRAANDTIKAKIYNRVGLYYMDVNLDSSFKYATIGMLLTQQMKWDKGISAFHTIYGHIFYRKGELDSALREYEQALAYSKKINDSINIGGSYNNLGTVANGKSDYVAAAQYYTYTLEIGKALKNYYDVGTASENLALVYQYQQDFQKGLDYARQSLFAYQQAGDESNYVSPLGLVGDLFLRMKNYDSAFYYYQKAIAVGKKTNELLKEGAVLNSLAEYYANRDDYRNAINIALEGKKIWDGLGSSYEDAITNKGLLGNFYLQLAKQNGKNKNDSSVFFLQLAKTYLDEAVQKSKATNNKNLQSEFQSYLADANALMGDYKNAYLNFKSYQQIKDSIFSQENKNKIAAIESQTEINKKNLEIEKQKLQVSEQKKNTFILLAGLVIMAAIGFLYYRLSAIRREKNKELTKLNNELDEANKIKAKFFGILSHDLRGPVASLINFLQLQKRSPGLMDAQQVAEKENKIADSANVLLETMDAMLLWSKGQMEYFKPAITNVQSKNLFAYIENFFSGTPNVSFTFFDENNLTVATDENYLRCIMQNLTSNAVKALSQTPGAKIIWNAWQEQRLIHLSITDNGPGVNEEQLTALYDEKTGSGAKHGLGLHIIRDLAKAIGCVITRPSQIEAGTQFILTLSVADTTP